MYRLMQRLMKHFPLRASTSKQKYCISHDCIVAENVLGTVFSRESNMYWLIAVGFD